MVIDRNESRGGSEPEKRRAARAPEPRSPEVPENRAALAPGAPESRSPDRRRRNRRPSRRSSDVDLTSTERNDDANGVPRDSILRFDPTATGATLNATKEWNLTADLTSDLGAALGPNTGLQAVRGEPGRLPFTTRGGKGQGPAANVASGTIGDSA
jgi:hypothetical protein